MTELGLDDWLAVRVRNWGLRASGFGTTLLLPWPGGALPRFGSAARRTELDAAVRQLALDAGARGHTGRVTGCAGTALAWRRWSWPTARRCAAARWWWPTAPNRDWVGCWAGAGIAGPPMAWRLAATSPADATTTLDLLAPGLRDDAGEVLSGYGWVFPLADGTVNIGVGTLATEKHPAEVNLRRLLSHYAQSQREEWQLTGAVQAPKSALLPMGGAVSGVAGRNWLLIGDAAGCVNPLNGEDRLRARTGRLAAEFPADRLRPQRLAGPAAPSVRRSVLDRPPAGWPVDGAGAATDCRTLGMRSRSLMKVALRLMGNLVTEADTDAVARAWRLAGRASVRLDDRPPWSDD